MTTMQAPAPRPSQLDEVRDRLDALVERNRSADTRFDALVEVAGQIARDSITQNGYLHTIAERSVAMHEGVRVARMDVAITVSALDEQATAWRRTHRWLVATTLLLCGMLVAGGATAWAVLGHQAMAAAQLDAQVSALRAAVAQVEASDRRVAALGAAVDATCAAMAEQPAVDVHPATQGRPAQLVVRPRRAPSSAGSIAVPLPSSVAVETR